MARRDRDDSANNRRGSGGFVTVGVVLTVVGSMMATLFGAGAASRVLDVFDGNVWLWSASKGEVSRVNSASGRVDIRQPLTDTLNHRVQVIQTDKNLILRDLTTGKVTSLDLATLGISGTVATDPGEGITVALHKDTAFIIDSKRGVIRQVDPSSLSPVGKPLTFPNSLQGGAFDDDGKLWVAVPSEGTVVRVGAGRGGPSKPETFPVTDTDHNVKLTVLDHGAALVDQTKGALFTIRDEKVKPIEALAIAPTADVPPRNRGNVVPVTLPDERKILIERNGRITTFPVKVTGAKIGPAVAFNDRVYINDGNSVLVYDYDGKQLQEIEVPDAGGQLELEVREEHLFINAPKTASARVIDSDHRIKPINKYPQDVLGSEKPDVSSLLNVPAKGNKGPNTRENSPNGDQKPTKQSPPGPPGSVTATAGNKSARLVWAPAPSNGAGINSYVIEGGGTSKRVSGRSRSTVIDGLDNGTEYSFTVYAVNAKGPGPKATSNTVRPTAEVPDPPASVTAKENAQGGVAVSWPAADDQGSDIASYTVTAAGGGDTIAFDPTENTNLAVEPGKLQIGKQYTFTIVSNTSKNASSAPSKPSNAVTPYTKPEAPDPVTATAQGEGEVKVTWTTPPQSGRPVERWIINATTKGDIPVNDPSLRAYTITGLGNGTQVDVTVRAVNEAGDGAPGKDTAKTNARPDVKVVGKSANQNSITVNFDVQENGAKVTECALAAGGKRQVGRCNSITLGGLTAGTDYDFTVTAKNGIGTGQDKGSVKTDPVTEAGAARCDDPGDNYCRSPGIGIFTCPSQQNCGNRVETAYDGNRYTGTCKARGNQSITAAQYNNDKTSWEWIRIRANRYIPYAWFNLDGGNAALNRLPRC
jgi:hypothetical protein